jgi:hypothetical protein
MTTVSHATSKRMKIDSVLVSPSKPQKSMSARAEGPKVCSKDMRPEISES